jgi:hypothetical protein
MSRRRNTGSQELHLPVEREIIAGVDTTYYDPNDDFWGPIRAADERDKAAHGREVKAAAAAAQKATTKRGKRGGRRRTPKAI